MIKIFNRPLFGHADDDAIIPWSWRSQNLDERPGDTHEASGSKLMHGRGWLNMGKQTLNLSWNLRSDFCHANLCVSDSEREVTAGLALPPVAIWIGVSGLPERLFEILGVDYKTVKSLPDGVYLTEREVRIGIHHWALWWSLWMPEGMSKSSDPRWRRGCLHFIDVIFGKHSFNEIQLDAQAVLVPMPERNYRGTVKVARRTWTRARWPFRSGPKQLFMEEMGYTISMESGEQIPIPGKGENSWDCDDDAVFSQSGPGGVPEAIASVVESVFRTRRKHGGSIAWQPEAPADRIQA